MSVDVSQLDPKRWKALAIIATAQLMMVLDSSIVNIALPKASLDLGIQPTSQQWVVTAYSLAFGSLVLLGGRVSDYLGRKRIFQIGLGEQELVTEHAFHTPTHNCTLSHHKPQPPLQRMPPHSNTQSAW